MISVVKSLLVQHYFLADVSECSWLQHSFYIKFLSLCIHHHYTFISAMHSLYATHSLHVQYTINNVAPIHKNISTYLSEECYI